MNVSSKNISLLSMLFLIGLLWMAACESDLEPDDGQINNPNNPGNPAAFDPDKAAEALVLKDARKISGGLPLAPSSGPLKINIEDTIYVVKGFPFGARVVVKHDGLHDISGFFIGVENSSFYYDVPVIEAESQDSTVVIFINLDHINGLDWDFPFPITLLPHVDGIPIKKFIRVIKQEDAEDEEVCSPLTPAPQCFYDENNVLVCPCESGCWYWIWEFTVVEDATGDIHTAYAPGMFIENPEFQHGGCCWNGISTPAKYDPYCVSGNPEYHLLTVDDVYYVRHFEALDLFDNNVYERWTRHEDKNYHTDSSNYCTGEAGYIVDSKFTKENGKHDFTPGARQIKLTATGSYNALDSSEPSANWLASSGEISYTCHSLIISFPFNGEKWSTIYRKSMIDFNPLETYFPEYYE
jgi:hypothetical protein